MRTSTGPNSPSVWRAAALVAGVAMWAAGLAGCAPCSSGTASADPHAPRLAAGGTADAVVASCRWETRTGIFLERGGRYRFDVEGEQTWRDWTVDCGADGWSAGGLARWTRGLRRAPGEDLFVLMGRVDGLAGRDFAIGRQGWVTAPAGGELICYANDVGFMYWNNAGSLRLTVRRLE